jgi:LysR family nitrogen assimilation transcriptional regulator
MDLVQLRYFVRIAALKSFSRAAAELRVAQPALTRQVRLLEEELGVRLLIRHHRGAEPTESGLILMNGAQAVLRLIDTMRNDVISGATEVTGRVRLGFPPSIGWLLVGEIVPDYRARFPGVFLQLLESYSEILCEWLLSDRLDIAVTTEGKPNPLLSSQPLLEEELWVLMPPDASKQRWQRQPCRLADLAKLPLIQTSSSNELRIMLERSMASAGLALNVVLEAEALPVIKDLIRQGIGYSVSPYSVVFHEIATGEFSGQPLEGLAIRRVLRRRLDRPLTLAAQEMIHAIEKKSAEIILRHQPSIRMCH